MAVQNTVKYQVQCGSFHQEDKRFSDESRGKQGYLNCLLYFAHSNLKTFDKFKAEDFETILLAGDALYRYVKSTKSEIIGEDGRLRPTSLPQFFRYLLSTFESKWTTITFNNDAVNSTLGKKDKLIAYFTAAKLLSNYFVIEFLGNVIALKHDNGKYYAFDPQSRNRSGTYTTMGGQCVLCTFSDIPTIATYLYLLASSLSRTTDLSSLRYYIYSCKLKTLPDAIASPMFTTETFSYVKFTFSSMSNNGMSILEGNPYGEVITDPTIAHCIAFHAHALSQNLIWESKDIAIIMLAGTRLHKFAVENNFAIYPDMLLPSCYPRYIMYHRSHISFTWHKQLSGVIERPVTGEKVDNELYFEAAIKTAMMLYSNRAVIVFRDVEKRFPAISLGFCGSLDNELYHVFNPAYLTPNKQKDGGLISFSSINALVDYVRKVRVTGTEEINLWEIEFDIYTLVSKIVTKKTFQRGGTDDLFKYGNDLFKRNQEPLTRGKFSEKSPSPSIEVVTLEKDQLEVESITIDDDPNENELPTIVKPRQRSSRRHLNAIPDIQLLMECEEDTLSPAQEYYHKQMHSAHISNQLTIQQARIAEKVADKRIADQITDYKKMVIDVDKAFRTVKNIFDNSKPDEPEKPEVTIVNKPTPNQSPQVQGQRRNGPVLSQTSGISGYSAFNITPNTTGPVAAVQNQNYVTNSLNQQQINGGANQRGVLVNTPQGQMLIPIVYLNQFGIQYPQTNGDMPGVQPNVQPIIDVLPSGDAPSVVNESLDVPMRFDEVNSNDSNESSADTDRSVRSRATRKRKNEDINPEHGNSKKSPPVPIISELLNDSSEQRRLDELTAILQPNKNYRLNSLEPRPTALVEANSMKVKWQAEEKSPATIQLQEGSKTRSSSPISPQKIRMIYNNPLQQSRTPGGPTRDSTLRRNKSEEKQKKDEKIKSLLNSGKHRDLRPKRTAVEEKSPVPTTVEAEPEPEKAAKRRGSNAEEKNDKNRMVPMVYAGYGKKIPLDEYYYGKREGDPTYTEQKDEFRFKCACCFKMLYNNVKVMLHLQGHLDSEKQQNLDLAHLTQCKHCFRHFDTPFEVTQHVEKVHKDKMKLCVCRICERDFGTTKLLATHMKGSHEQCEMPYVCHLCQFRSSLYDDVIDHFKKNHDRSQYILCLYCLKVFKVPIGKDGVLQTTHVFRHLQKHQSKTRGLKGCMKCKLAFTTSSQGASVDMDYHKRNEHGSNKRQMGSAMKSLCKSSRVMIDMPDKNKPKSLNAATISRIQDLKLQFPINMSRYRCVECEISMSVAGHYRKYVQCSLCRFATICSDSFSMHMMNYHSGKEDIKIANDRPMSEVLYCACGYSSKYGSSLANHLVNCSKTTCYTYKPSEKKIIKKVAEPVDLPEDLDDFDADSDSSYEPLPLDIDLPEEPKGPADIYEALNLRRKTADEKRRDKKAADDKTSELICLPILNEIINNAFPALSAAEYIIKELLQRTATIVGDIYNPDYNCDMKVPPPPTPAVTATDRSTRGSAKKNLIELEKARKKIRALRRARKEPWPREPMKTRPVRSKAKPATPFSPQRSRLSVSTALFRGCRNRPSFGGPPKLPPKAGGSRSTATSRASPLKPKSKFILNVESVIDSVLSKGGSPKKHPTLMNMLIKTDKGKSPMKSPLNSHGKITMKSLINNPERRGPPVRMQASPLKRYPSLTGPPKLSPRPSILRNSSMNRNSPTAKPNTFLNRMNPRPTNPKREVSIICLDSDEEEDCFIATVEKLPVPRPAPRPGPSAARPAAGPRTLPVPSTSRAVVASSPLLATTLRIAAVPHSATPAVDSTQLKNTIKILPSERQIRKASLENLTIEIDSDDDEPTKSTVTKSTPKQDNPKSTVSTDKGKELMKSLLKPGLKSNNSQSDIQKTVTVIAIDDDDTTDDISKIKIGMPVSLNQNS